LLALLSFEELRFLGVTGVTTLLSNGSGLNYSLVNLLLS